MMRYRTSLGWIYQVNTYDSEFKTIGCQTTIFPDGRILNVIDTPVLTLRGRFTQEEAASIQSLKTFFGPTITDYMIVLFTGDDYFDKDMLREDFLSKSPHELQEILQMCKKRIVFFFDNKTNDERKKTSQLTNLLILVDKVIEDGNGKPYTDSLFLQFKVESKLKEISERLQEQLANEKEARLHAEKRVQKKLRERLKIRCKS
ncbi:hypothetical protein V2J09_023261 [Rumex salicifolius]